MAQCFWLKYLHLETNYIKFESIGAVILQSLERSFPFSLLLRYTDPAAVAAFQGPAQTALQTLWHLFVANIIAVYLPSVILALPFQSLVIALERVCPNLMMEQ